MEASNGARQKYSTSEKAYTYESRVLETDIDFLGHMNHAAYLKVFELARWDILAHAGLGIDYIKENSIGPVILEAQIKYQSELKGRDAIRIVSHSSEYSGLVGAMKQTMYRVGSRGDNRGNSAGNTTGSAAGSAAGTAAGDMTSNSLNENLTERPSAELIVKYGIFNLQTRKLIPPPKIWCDALGILPIATLRS